jgi:hypothetical protein
MSNPYLDAAYIVTWVIHIAYLSIVYRRYSRVKKEIEELRRK